MNRAHFATIFLLTAGCTARKAPAVAVAPTTAATPPPIVVVAPPLTFGTPTPDPERARMLAIVHRELQRLKSASPKGDFAAAWANKDKRFIGVHGVGLSIPDVPNNRYSELIEKYGANPVDGTTDGIYALEVAQLNAVATRYATRYAARYNQLLLAKLDGQNTAKAG